MQSLQAWAEPALTLSRSVAPPAGTVTVAGNGFGASKAIDIYFDTHHLCLTVTDSVGQFRCPVKVPSSAQPVMHWLTAVERRTGIAAQQNLLVRINWSHFHGLGANRRGSNPFENTLRTTNVTHLDMLWTAPTVGLINSAPVVADGRVYVGASDGKLYAFDAVTGATAAGFPVDTVVPILEIESSPVVAHGTVYVCPAGGGLFAFDAQTGIRKAGFPRALGGVGQFASPAIAAGIVYIGTGKLYAFDAHTGVIINGFPKRLASNVSSSPTVANGIVYIGNDGKLYAFHAKTGRRIVGFPRRLGGGFVRGSAPAVASGIVYIGGSDGKLYAFNAFTGADIVGFPVRTGGEIFSAPAIAQNRVYVGASDHRVYAWNATTGAQFWSFTADSAVSTPEVASGVVYVASQHILYAQPF